MTGKCDCGKRATCEFLVYFKKYATTIKFCNNCKPKYQYKELILFLENNITKIKSRDEYIVKDDGMEPIVATIMFRGVLSQEEAREWQRKLIAAYNSTYGQGIHPESLTNIDKYKGQVDSYFDKLDEARKTISLLENQLKELMNFHI